MKIEYKAQKSPFSSAINENAFKSAVNQNAFKRIVKTGPSSRRDGRPSPEGIIEAIDEAIEYIRKRRARLSGKEAKPGDLAEMDLEEEFDEEVEEK